MNCTHCKHYKPLEDTGMMLDYGECRRFPPSPLVDADGDPFTMFPQVDEGDQCGEWAPKQ